MGSFEDVEKKLRIGVQDGDVAIEWKNRVEELWLDVNDFEWDYTHTTTMSPNIHGEITVKHKKSGKEKKYERTRSYDFLSDFKNGYFELPLTE